MPVTKRLTLIRHATAVSASAAAPDEARELCDDGETEAQAAGRRLRERGARPSLILTSTAQRALQTARLIAEEISYPREFLQREAELYLATPSRILAVLSRQDNGFNDILVCGHNPGLTELAIALTGSTIGNIPTCGLVVIEAQIGGWDELGPGAVLNFVDFQNARTD